MRTASICALVVAFGCSSPNADPSPIGSGGVTGSTGGAASNSGGSVAMPTTGGSTTGGLTTGGSATAGAPSTGGASGGGPSNGGSSTGGAGIGGSSTGGASKGGSANGGAGKGGSATGGASKGGASNGGMNGAGMSSGGSLGGSSSGGKAGQPSGGSSAGTGGAATGGSGGATGCVKNLACKLTAPPTTGDLHQDCVDRINQFLTQCACLPALTRRTDGEACADQMAEYDASKNMAHAGYTDKICQPAGSQNSCPGYSSNAQVIGLCMQQMWDEGPPPTSTCTGACYEEHGHFINMTDKSVTKVACGFFTTSAGKVWAVQNFSR